MHTAAEIEAHMQATLAHIRAKGQRDYQADLARDARINACPRIALCHRVIEQCKREIVSGEQLVAFLGSAENVREARARRLISARVYQFRGNHAAAREHLDKAASMRRCTPPAIAPQPIPTIFAQLASQPGINQRLRDILNTQVEA